MSVEYDLVVIGASPEGIFAAIAAAALNARVALVEQPFPGDWGTLETFYHRIFSHVVGLTEQLETAVQIGIYEPTPKLEIQLTQITSWTQEVHTILSEQNSSAILASKGIDVIKGSGEFCRLPQQAFIAGKRKLRSRKYLLATGSHWVVPYLEGIESVGYLTPNHLYQKERLEFLPANLVIVGASPLALQLAQNLRQTGRNITFIGENKQFLPLEDPEAAKLIQAQLEASGIKILLESPIVQVQRIEEKKWLQAGDRALETDEIILAGKQQPNLEGLNLESVGVCINNKRIQLNEKLQTTNPRIYACGSVGGGYSLSHIDRYEATIAVKNALFLPILKVDYRSIPYVIDSHPPLARVGMTEAQARRDYGDDVEVVKQNFKAIAQAQLLGATTGFCKLVIRRNGEILGAHIVGTKAEELIGAIALAMKQKIKLGAIAHFLFPAFTFSEILQQTASDWQQQRFKNKQNWQKFLENWFIWLRNLTN
jgi:pyruvate/2-oxoglutarate dehydrogenase complex dihydrolipoamide dehydrogenase (E3) component